MGKNACHDAYVVSVRKVVTSRIAICVSHVSSLRMVVIYQCITHFIIVTISIHSLLELITGTVRDWSEKLANLFSWSIGFVHLRE